MTEHRTTSTLLPLGGLILGADLKAAVDAYMADPEVGLPGRLQLHDRPDSGRRSPPLRFGHHVRSERGSNPQARSRTRHDPCRGADEEVTAAEAGTLGLGVGEAALVTGGLPTRQVAGTAKSQRFL